MTQPTAETAQEPWEQYFSTSPPDPNQSGLTPAQLLELDARHDEAYFYGEY